MQNKSMMAVAEVSPEALSTLVKKCLEGRASADEQGALEEIRTDMVNAYLASGRPRKPDIIPLLDLFLRLGSVRGAADQQGVAKSTAADWIADFSRFCEITRAKRTKRESEYQAALAQCQMSCGRKAHGGPSFGPEKWNSRSVTKEVSLPLGGRCADCPLTRLGR